MVLKAELKIPVGQTLIIRGPLLARIADLWIMHFDGKVDAVHFAMQQLFSIFMKKIKFSGPIAYDYDRETLRIWSNEELTLELVDDTRNIFVNLKLLATEMLHLRRLDMAIPANRQLIFYDLTPSELENINSWCVSENAEVKKGIKEFLLSKAPLGFSWNLNFDRGLFVGIAQANPYFGLSSNYNMTLSLVRPKNGEVFALTLIQNLNSSLAEGVAEARVEALLNLLFKSIFYFCCDNFRYFPDEKIPDYFKEETRLAMEAAIKDKTFNEHLEKILQDHTLLDRLNAINALPPEEFDQSDTEENESIKYIVNRIKGIANSELQGSLYLTESVKAVSLYLEKKQIASSAASGSASA